MYYYNLLVQNMGFYSKWFYVAEYYVKWNCGDRVDSMCIYTTAAQSFNVVSQFKEKTFQINV